MPNLDDEFIRLIRSALTAIDGLWFLEVENKYGFEKAFDMDLKVWKRYGSIIIKRIKKYLSISDNNLDSFLKILEIMCAIDGTQFKIKKKSPEEVILRIQYCPWWENLKRSNRENLVRCDIVDKLIFPEWAKFFNPNLEFHLSKSIPNGHDTCEWVISIKD
ncbi:MAG: L-2-amino-thiazoline-4-carboxylic acid hydrolase [Candidatus Helarchaeota archaeon]|nr:L-2-amino-thiazoline-4-carboxylic acid hydrolase [Candidatus Helarchaeota archaeon]